MPLTKPFERKKTPKATKRPTVKDLYWAAGLLEGEGCFFWHAHSGSEQITVGMTDKEPIDRLQELFGGSVREKKTIHKTQWHWNVHGGRARGIMMTLFSLLSPRRQAKIRECLNAKNTMVA